MYSAQPQPMYGQQQPMMMQQQPMMMQQQPMMMQQQPMMMQQQPIMMQQQPIIMQQQQPVYVQQQHQPVYVQQQPQQQVFVQQPQPQPVFVQQQPVVQVVGGAQFGQGGAGLGAPGAVGPSGPTTEAAKGDTAKLFEELKKANSFKLRYMDANFRGEGGFTFAVYLRGSSSQLATIYTNKSGEISFETVDKDNSFAIAKVANNSATFFDPAKGTSALAGQIAFAEGSCGSWSFNAEQSGQRILALQNRQFNFCFACLCGCFYLASYFCCNNSNTLEYVNSEGDKIGSATYNTDDIRSYREMEASFEDNGTAQSRLFAILAAVSYFHKRVGTSIDRLKGMNDVNVSFH